jgi:hypothetical protein
MRTPHKIIFGCSTKNNEIGWACSEYGILNFGGFWWGNLREEDHVEELEVDGRMIL